MFPSGVFNAFSSFHGSRQNNDHSHAYDFDRFLQEERDRYHRALALSLAEQERRRREMDMIQKQLHMKEMEKRRDVADQHMERRREMEIRQYLQKKQQEEQEQLQRARRTHKIPIPSYHGRIVHGPDGHPYKIMYLHREEDDTPSTRKVPSYANHENPQSAITAHANTKPLEKADTELKNFIFDTDDIEDKAKFVHVDSNNDIRRLDTMNTSDASDASVCQCRNSDDSISTHAGVFDNVMNSKQEQRSLHPDTTKQKTLDMPKVKGIMKKVHPSISKTSSIRTQDRNLKIVQGIDGKFYKVLEEVDPYKKNSKHETKANLSDSLPNRKQEEPTPVKHNVKKVSGKKDVQEPDDDLDENHHFTDFYHEYPNMDRILRMLFDVVPEQHSQSPYQPQTVPQQKTEETSSSSRPQLKEQPLKSSIKTMPMYAPPSRIPFQNVTRVMRGPDGRLYQLKVNPHQDEMRIASHSITDDDIVDARGEPKYHHVRGPDGHLYKVKNVHYHEKYPTPSSEEPKDASDGDKTPKHENYIFVEDQDYTKVDRGGRSNPDPDAAVNKLLHQYQDRIKKSSMIPKDEKSLKKTSFYDTISEEDTFEPPEPVMDHVNEMSSPYEYIEGRDGILHDMNHKSLPKGNVGGDILAVDDEVNAESEEDTSEEKVCNNSLEYTHTNPTHKETSTSDSKVWNKFVASTGDQIGDVEDASDSEKEDEFDKEEHNLRPIWGQWLEPANDAELHKTEVLRSHNQ